MISFAKLKAWWHESSGGAEAERNFADLNGFKLCPLEMRDFGELLGLCLQKDILESHSATCLARMDEIGSFEEWLEVVDRYDPHKTTREDAHWHRFHVIHLHGISRCTALAKTSADLVRVKWFAENYTYADAHADEDASLRLVRAIQERVRQLA